MQRASQLAAKVKKQFPSYPDHRYKPHLSLYPSSPAFLALYFSFQSVLLTISLEVNKILKHDIFNSWPASRLRAVLQSDCKERCTAKVKYFQWLNVVEAGCKPGLKSYLCSEKRLRLNPQSAAIIASDRYGGHSSVKQKGST